MGSDNLILIILIMVIVAGIYATYNKRNKIFCWFEGKDGTNEHKWVKDSDGWVIFRNQKFKIMPERMSTMWVKTGIHMLFPTRASCLSFTWESQYPRNPHDKMRTVINPSVRKIMNLSDLLESYFKTSSPSTSSKKETFLSKYLPYIAVIVVVIMAWYFYTNMQGLAEGLNTLQNQINTLAR